MAFINKEELQNLHADNAAMRSELEEWRRMAPFLELGKELQSELVGALGSTAMIGVSAEEIGESAYLAVKAKEEESAREKLTTEYEQTHRKALYERVVKEVDKEEGKDILASVLTRLESDAKLAKELRDSARTELTARAHDIVAAQVTAEQQAVIEAETTRQIALDRFDVQFALCGELELDDPLLQETLSPNDKLIILFEKSQLGQTGMEFVWTEDINGATGWVYADSLKPKNNNHYNSLTVKDAPIPRDRFVSINSQLPDLTKGTTGIKQATLVEKRPIVIGWTDNDGKTKQHAVKQTGRKDGYETKTADAVICGTDLQTKDIVFVKGPAK